MKVTIPACDQHEGMRSITVEIADTCPVCGGPRGNKFKTYSFDGSLELYCDGWRNPCGHIDKYYQVRKEAKENGLNG